MTKRKYPIMSFHPTLYGQLEVDWEKEYQHEFFCPHCQVAKLTSLKRKEGSVCKLRFSCNSCNKCTNLTCPVPAYIFSYRSKLECPNPLCDRIGHDGQKGWIFQNKKSTNQHECRFCGISFNPSSTSSNSWSGSQIEDKILTFCFDKDRWDLRHFYEKPFPLSINFSEVHPQWYRLEVKKYLQYLLKSRRYSSPSGIRHTLGALKQIGKVIKSYKIEACADLSREMIHSFLDEHSNLDSKTINHKLGYFKSFFEWLELDESFLIRSRDRLKEHRHDPNWLDEITREAIHQHLPKIPAPIGRQYLVQEYIAVRPDDMSSLSLDCLVENNGNWYVKFLQGKSSRRHRIPANREIRKVIEEQQQWVRETLGSDYSHLFCHFRGAYIQSYPNFPGMKPLPVTITKNGDGNTMLRIIRMLIEKEDVRDANGQQPHFTGKITRPSKLQEIRVKHGIKAAQLYADHARSETTLRHYAPPTREQVY